ncbi:MFS transporter [Kutzneria sp. CA-103260]|uniref:MFS transporter n=1 Tax=Kutzneria sp. CA-103260 TaxID=2802641 RepID=UPI001BA9F954|nr:MFS transporter [Kutzneria sp. CA-103260]QUQ67977.1 major facilitator superfamily transporter [Kutzneria sp. CA-103260]
MSVNRSRGGVVLLSALVLDSVGNGMFQPLSLFYFFKLTPVPLALIGVLVSLANAVTLPIPVLAGWLADRVGPLPLVVASQVAQGIGYLAFAWVHGPVGIFLASSLVTIGVRFFWSSVFTAIADFSDGSVSTMSKDSWYAWANMTRTGGLGIGGLITTLAVVGGSDALYRVLSNSSAVCYLVAAAAIAAFVRAPRRVHETGEAVGYATMLRDRPFVAFAAINTVFAVSTGMLALGLLVFVTTGLGGPAWLPPALLAGNTILLALLGAPVIKRVAPYRRTRVLIAAAGLWAAWCLAFAGLVPNQLEWVIPALILATLLYTAADVLHAPVSMGLATALSPLAARGRYLAVFQYSFTIANMISPAFFTALFELHRSLPWLALGLLNLAALGGVLLLERIVPDSAQRVAEPARA